MLRKRVTRTRRLIVIALCGVFAVVGLGYVTLWHANDPIPPTTVEVREGESLTTIANTLEDAGVIQSAFWFRSIVILRDGESSIKAGTYRFNHVEPEYTTAARLMSGNYGILEWKVTVPEGFAAFDITERIASTTGMAAFSTKESDRLFIQYEGMLFPETYFISEVSTPEGVVKRMTDEFAKRIKEINFDLDGTYEFYGRPYSGREVLIMASIIEGEANTEESRRTVSDILWRRLSADHPLQVDATLQYITGRGSADLTTHDLERDHLYNTYTRNGLPPTPINNPGEDAILAALGPTANEYNYFLTGDDGEMYYAHDFEAHKRNKALHIAE
jgi:UPF0755 protein